MSGPAVLFREIHRLRRLARDVQEQIERAPRQLKIQQAKVARQEEIQREAQETLKKLKITVHEKEVSLKATHGLIAKYQKQFDKAESKKEYDALKSEIAAAQQECRKFEDEILNGMTETEELTARLPELEKNVQKARQEFAEWEKGAAERNAALTRQLEETQAKLKEVEAQLPPGLLPQYQRVVNALGADALAAVQGHTCTACNTEITAQNYTDLVMENFVACKACGRILYLPE